MKKIWLGLLSVAVSINLYGADKVYTIEELYTIVKHENTDLINKREEKRLIGEKVSDQCEVTEVDEVMFGDGYKINCKAPSGKFLSLETEDIRKVENLKRGEYINFSGVIKVVKAENDIMDMQSINVDIEDLYSTSGEGDVSSDTTEALSVIQRETKACLDSKSDVHSVYTKLTEVTVPGSKSELVALTNYQRALYNIAVNCDKIYAFREDAKQAARLALELKTAIEENKSKSSTVNNTKRPTNTKSSSLDGVLPHYAYKLMTGKSLPNGNSIKIKYNSEGIKIYCLANMSMCKTEAEVVNYFENS